MHKLLVVTQVCQIKHNNLHLNPQSIQCQDFNLPLREWPLLVLLTKPAWRSLATKILATIEKEQKDPKILNLEQHTSLLPLNLLNPAINLNVNYYRTSGKQSVSDELYLYRSRTLFQHCRNINYLFWQAKRCWKWHPNALNCPYRQSFVVLFGGDVQFSCNVNILHGHKALVFGEGLFYYLNSRGHIIGFVVTPIKHR